MKITANMATVPARIQTAKKAIKSIYDQVSLIRLYLNNFKQIPREFKDDKIVVYRGKDLQSSGKVFWAKNPDEYYFCIDDDILYPPDYVEHSLSKLKEYEEDVIISYHGRRFPKGSKIENYFKAHSQYFHFAQQVINDVEADVIGNGVSCWNTNRIHIDVEQFPYLYMDDILVSARASEQGKKRIVVAHKANYLKPLQTTNLSLYDAHKKGGEVQTKVYNSFNW